MLEVASESTADVDVGAKRRDYAALGIPEYWRFDHTETGRYHGARLAGDRLEDGDYAAIEIEELPDGNLQGYSPALDLYLRWEQGELVFYDPATGQHVLTYADQLARAQCRRGRAGRRERSPHRSRSPRPGAGRAASPTRSMTPQG